MGDNGVVVAQQDVLDTTVAGAVVRGQRIRVGASRGSTPCRLVVDGPRLRSADRFADADRSVRSSAGVRGQASGVAVARFLRGRWLPCLEERARRRRAEDAIPFDLFVHDPQPIAVALHAEVGHGPDHLAEEEHHRSDIEELEL